MTQYWLSEYEALSDAGKRDLIALGQEGRKLLAYLRAKDKEGQQP